MKPSKKDQYAPCMRKFKKLKPHCKCCNRCVYWIKIHWADEVRWRCTY